MKLWQPAFGIAAAAALGIASLALAHSTKETTKPEDGAVLASSPAEIGMTFDTPMRITMIKLTDSGGAEHDVTRTDNMAPITAFAASPGKLGAGEYTVEWRGLSEDGHQMNGRFSFKVAK